ISLIIPISRLSAVAGYSAAAFLARGGISCGGMRQRRQNPWIAHPTDVHVGAQLRMLRLQHGLSQTGLAERVGLSFQQIQKYETGSNRVSVSRLVDLANALDIPLLVFFDGLPLSNGGPSHSATFREPDPIDYDIARLIKRVDDRRLRRQIHALIRS